MKVAVITGAAQGIGRRTAETLASRGFALLLNDLRAPTDTLSAIRSGGGEAIEFVGNVADEQVVGRCADAARARWGRVDVLVNNAGISLIAAAEKTSVEDF